MIRRHVYGGEVIEHDEKDSCPADLQDICDAKFSGPNHELIGTIYEATESPEEKARRMERLKTGHR